jgi:DMSO/TMAO reductase YedYZ molybdopterin-dependent catalytic subunit
MAEGTPVGRRIVLGMIALGGVGVVAGSRARNAVENVLGPVEERDPTGLTGLVPVGGGFRFYSVTASVPRRSAADYRLTVGGLVERPATHTMASLAAMRQTTMIRDFQCVTGWRVPQVHWSGVRLGDVIRAAGPRPGATAVRLTSFDGAYDDTLTLEQAYRPDVIVALSMLGGPITHDHGGPVRLYVAPMYGYKSVKWLGGIELTAGVSPGYWEQRGYDVDAWIGKSNGRDDDPA